MRPVRCGSASGSRRLPGQGIRHVAIRWNLVSDIAVTRLIDDTALWEGHMRQVHTDFRANLGRAKSLWAQDLTLSLVVFLVLALGFIGLDLTYLH
jgi:hypothetical protein